MRQYFFGTNHFIKAFNQCVLILKEQGYEVLDVDRKGFSIEATIKDHKLYDRQLYIHLYHESSNSFCLNIEARSVLLEMRKSRQNKRLELLFVRAFHRYVINQQGPKKMAQSA